MDIDEPLLRVPPFPGAKVQALARPRPGPTQLLTDEEADELIELLLREGVARDYWSPSANSAREDLEAQSSTQRRATFRSRVEPFEYADPFTGEPIGIRDAIRLCAFWRGLIERNRDIGSAVGFAFWKRPTVTPLLWDGVAGPRFVSRMKDIEPARSVAVWKARTAPKLLAEIEQSGSPLVEVEDGFIRSAGLGADCVPPLSIVVDRLGAHFDPRQQSELEQLLNEAAVPDSTLERAACLRELIVASGVGKYGAGRSGPRKRSSERTHVLVPGQVEDDRAILLGAGEVKTNLELLRRVRERRPDAHIIYKPHPDVEAGHRAGRVADADVLRIANEIVREEPITALLATVDDVHVISSLAGFEALLRGKAVTTHGVPFYAGWGLTTDLGPVPARRTRRRTLDELVAIVLLEYPRYLDPVSGLPCPPEVLIRRIAEDRAEQSGGAVVQLRRLQGRLKKQLSGQG